MRIPHQASCGYGKRPHEWAYDYLPHFRKRNNVYIKIYLNVDGQQMVKHQTF